MNLRSIGHDDSSSEEAEKPIIPTKPAVPPRTRLTMAGSDPMDSLRRQTAKEKMKPMRHSLMNDRHGSLDLDSTLTNNHDGEITNDLDKTFTEDMNHSINLDDDSIQCE